ncbi:MAG: PilN domain-containing protein [Arenimonas sp.]|nr:PilN domain-containing protein [Arenimonas sp.]
MPATDALFQVLEPLRLRYLESPLPIWLRTAGDALFAALPARLRRQLGMRYRRLLLSMDGNALQLRALLDDQSSLLGTVPLDDATLLQQLRMRLDESAGGVPRWLLIESRLALRPVLAAPASAEPRLREMMAHEIDRQTPFTLEQVTFAPRVLSRDPVTRQMRVELVVLPKLQLDAALAKLGPMAEGLAGVDIVDADGARLGLNLLPLPGRVTWHDSGRNLNWLLAAVAVLAVVASMWIALGNRREAVDAYSKRLASVTVEARDVRKLRNSLEASMRAANFLARQRAQQPTMLELVADLTRRIPDTTSVEKLSVNAGAVVLIGQSQQASSLVGLLQGSALIKKPTLTGSVQTDPRTGKERFTLTAVVAGSAKEKESANESGRSP